MRFDPGVKHAVGPQIKATATSANANAAAKAVSAVHLIQMPTRRHAHRRCKHEQERNRDDHRASDEAVDRRPGAQCKDPETRRGDRHCKRRNERQEVCAQRPFRPLRPLVRHGVLVTFCSITSPNFFHVVK